MLLDTQTAQTFLFLGRGLFVVPASLWARERRMRCSYRTRDERCIGRADAKVPLVLVDSAAKYFEQVAVTNLLWYYPTYGNELRERLPPCSKHDCQQTKRLKPNYS